MGGYRPLPVVLGRKPRASAAPGQVHLGPLHINASWYSSHPLSYSPHLLLAWLDKGRTA